MTEFAMPRQGSVAGFLHRAGWADARQEMLAGDASNRRYHRLWNGAGQTAVLMDAPRDRGEDVRPFIAVAEHLRGIGLSSPRLLAADPAHGLLLLEDLGDGLVARLAETGPEPEARLYETSVDVLTELHRNPVLDGIPDHAAEAWAGFAALSFETYAPAMNGKPAPDATVFRREMAALWHAHAGVPVMILRDYHAENLLWLPDRAGVARIGLLDFQDAQTGPRAYDLISLVEDARRDVPGHLRDDLTDRYAIKNGIGLESFRQQCAVVSAQRHLRILGVFARLIAAGKPRYAAFLPRTWAHLVRSLQAPGMERLADIVLSNLPPPDIARIVPA